MFISQILNNHIEPLEGGLWVVSSSENIYEYIEGTTLESASRAEEDGTGFLQDLSQALHPSDATLFQLLIRSRPVLNRLPATGTSL